MRRSEKYTIKNQVFQSILIFLFGGLVMGYLMCRPCFKEFSLAFSVVMYSGSMWLFLWKGNEYIYVFTDRYVSWFKTPIKRMFIGLGLMILYSSTAVTALTVFFFGVIYLNSSILIPPCPLKICFNRPTISNVVGIA